MYYLNPEAGGSSSPFRMPRPTFCEGDAMTPKRSLLLAVLCLGLLTYSGREVQAQNIIDAAENAHYELNVGYSYAKAAYQELQLSQGLGIFSNADEAFAYAELAAIYIGYVVNDRDYSSAYFAWNYGATATNYAYLAFYDNPSYDAYWAWYDLSQGTLDAYDVVLYLESGQVN